MDWLKDVLNFLPRFLVLNQDEGGLLLKYGKYKKTLGPGVYFLWPVIDEVVSYMVAFTTLDTCTQSVTTVDKRDLLISWSSTYLIHNPKRAFLETDDIEAQIYSSLSSRLLAYINQNEYQYLRASKITSHMSSEGFRLAFKEEWGIDLQGFYLKDLTLHRTIRLVNQSELTD